MNDDRRKARRHFVRKHHPDLGGDTVAFQEGLKSFEESAARKPAKPGVAPVVASPNQVAPTQSPPVTDRLARGLGRFVARTVAMPGEVKDAYRDGRHTDEPL